MVVVFMTEHMGKDPLILGLILSLFNNAKKISAFLL